MAILDPNDLAFDGEQIKTISEAIFESGFAKPVITEFHTVVTGIVAKKQIAILGRLNGLVGKGSGGCAPVASPNTITNSEKNWEPVMVSDRITECWDTLEDTFFVWSLKAGIERGDLTSTEFAVFLEELLVDAIWECVYRIAWFNDINADHSDATGVITPGTDLDFFNKIDGFWIQLFTLVIADPARLTAGISAKNAQATYALQDFNDTDTTNRVATKTLQNMRYGSDTRFRALTDNVYLTTLSFADQYERELTDAQTPFSTERLENGLMALKSGGISLIAFDFWDRMILAYENNGTTLNLPHRALLLNPDNMQIGTQESGSLANLKVIFDELKNEMHWDFAFNIDAKVIENYKFQAAY